MSTEPSVRKPGKYKTRVGGVATVTKWDGKHWIGKLNPSQHWQDRWEKNGEYAATSEKFRAFDLVEVVL